MLKKFGLAITVFISVFIILSIIQLKVENPMILLERFVKGGGWIELFVISLYAAYVTHKMQDQKNVAVWRRNIWLLFSIVFFGQFILGLIGFEDFLMTGKLHLPVPAMILAGPIFRFKITFMPILFLSTIILSGPAWCSQLCYFGALDNIAAKGKTKTKRVKNKLALKFTILIIVIAGTLLLKIFNISSLYAAIGGGMFGIIGIAIIIFISKRIGKMVHCIYYCPVGTVINYLRFINPFRMYIDTNCTTCMKCTSFCKYDALNLNDIQNLKPGITCTLCGDCLSSCHVNSIKYKFFKLNPETARKLYLGVTISLHAIFLALARM